MPDKNIVTIDEFKQKAKEEDTQDIAVRKQFTVEVKEVDEEERTIEVIASTKARDRDMDTINPEGWDLSDYEKNPVILWAHDYSKPPIGKAIANWIQDGQLRQKIKFAPKEANPFAEQVYQLYKGGFLNAVSVGFDPKEWDWSDEEEGNIDFEQQALLETSAVPVPSNPEALQVAGKEGIDTSMVQKWAKNVLKDEEDYDFDKREVGAYLADIWDVTTGEALDLMDALNPTEPQDRRAIAALVAREYEGLSVDDVLEVLAEAEGNENATESDEVKQVKDGRVLSTRNQELLEEAKEDIDLVLQACDDDDKEYIEQLEKEKEELQEQVKQLESEQSDYIELEEETLELADAAEDEKGEEIDINADELSTLIDNAVREEIKQKTGKIL